MKRYGAYVSEPMIPMSRNNKRLPVCQDKTPFIDPHLCLPGNYGENFLDRMLMCWNIGCGRYPLFEYAELSCSVESGNMHPACYPRSPLL